MSFLNPYMLWGILAVALPVAIHFWYQKKGKPIAWAASQWLADKTSLQHRGIRLDEIPLLLIRCLLVVLLAMLLSKPVIDWFQKDVQKEVIHLVQPDARVVSNFRFELENALQKKQKVVWIGPDLQPIMLVNSIPEGEGGVSNIQQNINSIAHKGTHLNLYLINNEALSKLPGISIPGSYRLHSIKDSVRKIENPLIGLNQKIGKERIAILIDYQHADESRTVHAGLEALSDVFGIQFNIDFKTGSQTQYDWIFTDNPAIKRNEQTVYVVPERLAGHDVIKNTIAISDSLRLATSNIVENGRLPEWLGEMFISHYELDNNDTPLSQRQLSACFQASPSQETQPSEGFRQWLLLLFVLTLLLERWISLRQNTIRKYA